MNILGIVPAAGQGMRWGGYTKEFLPQGDYTLIDRTITAMKAGGANRIAVVSTPDKLAIHGKHLSSRHLGVFLLVQHQLPELFGAIFEALPYSLDYNYFAMPDTVYPINAFMNRDWSHADIHLGLFETDKPERFGVMQRSKIIDKCGDLKGGKFYAWGVLVWSKKVSNYWYRNSFTDYTDALNRTLENFVWDTFPLKYYYDMATWSDYKEFIQNAK